MLATKFFWVFLEDVITIRGGGRFEWNTNSMIYSATHFYDSRLANPQLRQIHIEIKTVQDEKTEKTIIHLGPELLCY